jgi:hypothetical protein
MAVIYMPYQGEELSREIYSVFMAYTADTGNVLTLNEGHRTMLRQAELVRQVGLFNSKTNPTGAAWPSPFAPHIRTGRIDHAVDVPWQQWAAFMRWAAGKVKVFRPISSELWHWEFDAASLKRFFERRGYKYARRNLHPGMRHTDVKAAAKMLRKIGRFNRRPGKLYGPALQKAMKGFQRRNGLTPDGVVGPATWAMLVRRASK